MAKGASPSGLFDLTGQVALVTGSTQGIGLALAEGLARNGAAVALNGRNAAQVERTVDDFKNRGACVVGMPFDVTDKNQALSQIGRIEQDLGPITILVNNAGISRRGPFDEQSDEDWTSVLTTNVDGVRNVSAPILQSMARRNRGKIINVCSLSSERARPEIAAYAATKGALKMLTRALAVEFARHNIQINGLAPGYIKTALNSSLASDAEFDRWVVGRTPAGRWGSPEDLVGTALFLASGASDFVTGQIIYVDGGILAAL